MHKTTFADLCCDFVSKQTNLEKMYVASMAWVFHDKELTEAIKTDKDVGWPRPLVRACARMIQSI